MGKKNMDALLSNIMGEAIVRVTDVPTPAAAQQTEAPLPPKEKLQNEPSRHFTFICSTELANKVQAIARKEGFTIRSLMEFMIRQGIATYEGNMVK